MTMSIPVGTDVIIQNSTIFPQLNGFHAVIATDCFIHEKSLSSDIPWGYGWNLPVTDLAPVECNLVFDINSLI